MLRKHVILFDPTPQKRIRGDFRSTPSAHVSPKPLKIEFENLSATKAAEISQKKEVKAVAPVVPMKLIGPVKRMEDIEGNTWGISAVKADTSPFDGDGIVVSVLDTGIDETHPAFRNVALIRKNFTDESDDDLHGHGTHCAGTIFGRDVTGIRIGVAPGIKTALIGKVLGEGGGGSDILLSAIEWALQNEANVISMSLGIDFPGLVASLVNDGIPAEMATSMALVEYRANITLFEQLASLVRARSAFMQPCLIIAAAGNESRREENPDFKIAVSPPAAAEGIVSVSATTSTPEGMVIAPFSNFGARVSAPGTGVLSAKRGGGLIPMSGTSMATPHVAGVAALWAQKLLSLGQLNGRLFMDRLIGSGVMTAFKAGFDPNDFGSGIVQAPQN